MRMAETDTLACEQKLNQIKIKISAEKAFNNNEFPFKCWCVIKKSRKACSRVGEAKIVKEIAASIQN